MPTPIPSPDSPTTLPTAPALKAALDSLRDQLAQMPEADIQRSPSLDATSAAGVVIGSLPRIAKLRSAIAAATSEADAAKIDELVTVAYAVQQADIELKAADAATDLSPMHAAVLEDHALLLTDADSLANRKLIDRARVDAGRSTLGYRATIASTLVLVSLFREHSARVEGKTPVTAAELDRIEQSTQRMLERLNEREQGSTSLPAAELRIRALSMLIRLYSQVRRLVSFVRWDHGDADDVAPSLRSRSSRRARNGGEDDPMPGTNEPEAPVSPVVTPSPVNGGGPFTQ